MQYLSFKNRSLQLVGKYKQLWQFYIKIALLFFYETLVFPSKIVMQGNFIFKDLWFLVKIKPPCAASATGCYNFKVNHCINIFFK